MLNMTETRISTTSKQNGLAEEASVIQNENNNLACDNDNDDDDDRRHTVGLSGESLQKVFDKCMDKEIRQMEATDNAATDVELNDSWLDRMAKSSADLTTKRKELCAMVSTCTEMDNPGWKGERDRKRNELDIFHEELSRQKEGQWKDWEYLDQRLDEVVCVSVFDWADDFAS